MKRSTIIVLLLLLLIVTAVLYYWWRKAEPPAPGVAPSLVSLLPANASFVFYADAAALRSSPFVQKLLAVLPSPKEDREYAEFVRRTGFDYARDLDSVAIAISPSVAKSKGQRDETVLAIAEGRLDRAKIAAYAKQAGRRADQGGHEAYIVPAQNGGDVLVAFLAENRVLLTDNLAAQIPEANASDPERRDYLSPLNERVVRVAASELFAVAHVSPLPTNVLPTGIVSGELKKTLDSIQWITLALRPSSGQAARPAGDGLTVVLEAECASPGDAKKLAWSLEGLRVLARAALPGKDSGSGMDPALAALFDTVTKDGKITSAERYVRLSFSLGADFLTALKPSPAAPKKANR